MNTAYNLSTRLLYADFCCAGKEWCYKNIISPFTRIYIITKGSGAIYMNRVRYELKAGDLFIIPKFTSHTYECSNFIEHYYVCFFDEMINHRSIFDSTTIEYQLKATALDSALMSRLIEINQRMAIPFKDPKKYNTLRANKSTHLEGMSSSIESNGIILQLLSRFIAEYNPQYQHDLGSSYNKLTSTLNFIANNLSQSITVTQLSEMMCVSPDHFSRLFKRVMGVTPKNYIQNKRIERAQTLLITTKYNIAEVAQAVGIPNASQFSTLFTKITKCSPRQYLKSQQSTLQNSISIDE